MSSGEASSINSILMQISVGGATIITGQMAGMGLKFISEIAFERFSSIETYGSVQLGFSMVTIPSIVSISGNQQFWLTAAVYLETMNYCIPSLNQPEGTCSPTRSLVNCARNITLRTLRFSQTGRRC
jgi:hypothetical protein